MRKRFGSLIRLPSSAKCPLDEIGKNSVAAWIIARRISSAMANGWMGDI